jgi:uncharacterized membrane protein
MLAARALEIAANSARPAAVACPTEQSLADAAGHRPSGGATRAAQTNQTKYVFRICVPRQAKEATTMPTAPTDVPTRRRRIRRLPLALAPVAALAAALAVPVPATGNPTTRAAAESGPTEPPTTCAVERLAEPDGSRLSNAVGADRTGRLIVGFAARPDDSHKQHVLIWDDGEPTEIDLPGVEESLFDINSSGAAVGASFDPKGSRFLTPWIYRDGEVAALPGVDSGAATGINDRGDVTGSRWTDLPPRPVWWPAGAQAPIDLPVPDPAIGGEAAAIDEDGTIVGHYFDEPLGPENAFVWRPDGTGSRLPLPAGTTSPSRALHVENGWIIGYASTPDEELVDVRWHLGSGEVRTFPGLSRLTSVNAHGWMTALDANGNAVLVSKDNGAVPLPGLTQQGGSFPQTLSDDGRVIAGFSPDADGTIRAVRWRCN